MIIKDIFLQLRLGQSYYLFFHKKRTMYQTTFKTIIVLLFTTLLMLTSCKNKTPNTTTKVDAEVENPVTLEQKIGQMLMIGFRGLELTEENHIKKDVEELQIGGVVLYNMDVQTGDDTNRNIQSPEQLKKLISDLQALSQVPLLISIDQEGGRVNRLREKYGFPKPAVSAQYLGELDNLDSTAYWTTQTAMVLKDLGINFNYAPVVDVNVNPKSPAIGNIERSYSANPDLVAKHAEKVIEVYRKHGIISSIKHFPGHGSAMNDSHKGVTDVTKTWSNIELTPYKKLIAKDKCDVIMTAHVFNEKLDPDYPATLSKKVMTDLLRKQLKWDGVIISDDMHMGAIEKHYGLETAIEKAINAGVDIVMFSNNAPDFYDAEAASKAVALIKKLVKTGKITEARIDKAYQRIMAMKANIP